MNLEIRIARTESHHEELSIRQECLLLGINRSSYYLEHEGEKEYNLELMKRIDKEYQGIKEARESISKYFDFYNNTIMKGLTRL